MSLNAEMKPSARCVALTKAFEGCRLTSYQDSGGTWTIGYGRIRNDDGTFVQPGQVCTQEQAEQWLLEDLDSKGSHYVRAYVQAELTQDKFDALTDFCFNEGNVALHHSTLVDDINRGDTPPQNTALLFLPYDKASGVEYPGLERRRRAEAALFLGDYATMEKEING